MPSITECGLKRRMSRSWQVPGSLSSELQTTYFWPGAARGMKLHLTPVGNPAPPRPRRPEAFTSSMIASRGVLSERILRQAAYPPSFSYTRSVQLSACESGSNTTWFIARATLLHPLQRPHRRFRSQVLVVDVIHHHHRRVVAGREA